MAALVVARRGVFTRPDSGTTHLSDPSGERALRRAAHQNRAPSRFGRDGHSPLARILPAARSASPLRNPFPIARLFTDLIYRPLLPCPYRRKKLSCFHCGRLLSSAMVSISWLITCSYFPAALWSIG